MSPRAADSADTKLPRYMGHPQPQSPDTYPRLLRPQPRRRCLHRSPRRRRTLLAARHTCEPRDGQGDVHFANSVKHTPSETWTKHLASALHHDVVHWGGGSMDAWQGKQTGSCTSRLMKTSKHSQAVGHLAVVVVQLVDACAQGRHPDVRPSQGLQGRAQGGRVAGNTGTTLPHRALHLPHMSNREVMGGQ